MRSSFSNTIKSVLFWITRFTPKLSICVLRGFPSYEDNLVAIYQQLLKRGFRKVIWVVSNINEKPPIEIDPLTKFVARGSWQDYIYSITAKYLFITHGHFLNRIPSNQFCVNLWHGIPYKAIGRLNGSAGRSDTMVVATSELTRDIFAKSFGVDNSKVTITGQARTDRLFVENIQDLRRRILPQSDKHTKVFLWLPTYRSTDYAGGRTDGNDVNNIFNCTDFTQVEFNRYLANHNSVCIIKPHPLARQQKVENDSNLVFIDEPWLNMHGLTLYQLVGMADCLISDISSVIIDFMLLDRPIILLFEDIDEYEASRGFSFNPITDWLPATVARDFRNFMKEVDAVVNDQDRYRARRNALKLKFFTFDDNASSSRILDSVFNTAPGDTDGATPIASRREEYPK